MSTAPPLRRQDDTIFARLYCDELIVRPRTTPLKWDRGRSSPGISFLNNFDTARAAADAAAISTAEYIIGAAAARWIYNIFAATPALRVGFEPAAVAVFDVAEGDIIRFDLSMAAILLVTHERRPGAVLSRVAFNLAAHIGAAMRPWAAGADMSVQIMSGAEFHITVDPDGKSRMTGTTSDIVDFDLASIVANSGTPLPPAAPSNSIANLISGASVTAQNDGDIVHNGGISYKRRVISAAGPIAAIAADDFMVIIANPTIGVAQLPPAPASKAKKYIIARSYPIQPGETISNPFLIVVPQLGDTIDGGASIGLSPSSRVVLISDGGANWMIL